MVPGSAVASEQCQAPAAAQPILVTKDCEDPIYNEANFVIDSVTTVVTPVPHTKVLAHFKATATTPEYKVSINLPAKDRWQGRFFQHVYPLEQPDNDDDLAFALANGGYLVNVKGTPCGCGGYRPDAAAAKIAEAYARKFYASTRRVYGYVWGGSGGGLLIVGAIENTKGVWDGAVPYVLPNAGSLININAVGALGALALHDKFPSINAALKPGVHGDPEAALTPEQRKIFREELAMGIPLRSFETASGGGTILMFLSDGVRENDPTYVDDFWSKPGYEGANPADYLQAARVDQIVKIKDIVAGPDGAPAGVEFEDALKLGTTGGTGLDFFVYGADDKTVIGRLSGMWDGSSVKLMPGNDPKLLAQVKAGTTVHVSNLFFLALNFYHRHDLPTQLGMYAYDQFRTADGTPLYPQRSYNGAGAQALSTAGGGTQTGKINTKVIINQSLLDGGAAPWMADWYSKRVQASLGPKAYADNFRLYYNDNAEHLDIKPNPGNVSRVIYYVPALYQSLKDLIGWCEKGVVPPLSTTYSVENTQVHLPATAAERHGIQPVVTLKVAGSDSIETSVNKPVEFTAHIVAPTGAGKVTSTAWWFGEGDASLTPTDVKTPASAVNVKVSHTFSAPGTYYVTLRATSQREGQGGETLTSLQNLDRVRVIVR